LSLGLAPAKALTPAGTVISNVATVAYDGGSLDSNIALLTVTQLYGIALTPGTAALSGLPGQTLYFPVTLINTGNFVDNFQLGAVSQQGWGVRLIRDDNRDGVHQDSEQTAVSSTGTLDLLGQYCYFAALSIPAGAAAGLQDRLTLSAHCSANTSWRAEASCTGTALTLAGVTLQPSKTLMSALPATELYLSFTLTNSGNRPETFLLTPSCPQGWPVTPVGDDNQDGIHQSSETGAFDPQISLAPGAHWYGFLHTLVPAEFTETDRGQILLQAVSSLDAAVSSQGEYDISLKVIPPGDITGNGTVGPEDVNAVAQISLNSGTWTPEQTAAADINGDGVVNILDVMQLQSLAGVSSSTLSGGSTARQIALPTTTAAPGVDKTLGLTIDEGVGGVGFQTTILLDDQLLNVSQILPGSLMSNPQNWVILTSVEPGAITLLAYDATGAGLAAGAGSILSLQGAITPDAQPGPSAVLAWAEPIVANAQGGAFAPLTAVDGAVTVASQAFGAVQGKVLRAKGGYPLPGAQVEVWESEQMLSTTVSDSAGNWQFAGLPVGTYQVRASAVGYYAESKDGVAVSDGGVTSVNFSLTTVRRSKTGGVKGLVLSTSGSPIRKANIRFYLGGRKIASTSTNGVGGYSKVPLASADYTVVVTLNNCQPVTSEVAIRENEIGQRNFVLDATPIGGTGSGAAVNNSPGWLLP